MMEVTDTQLLEAVRMGARAANLSDRLGLNGSHRRALTRRMKKLEAVGLVRKREGYSSDNSYYWVRVE